MRLLQVTAMCYNKAISIQCTGLLEWTSGLTFPSKNISIILCAWYSWKLQIATPRGLIMLLISMCLRTTWWVVRLKVTLDLAMLLEHLATLKNWEGLGTAL